MANIAIVGLGLIGTSLGLALKRSKLAGLGIAGHDKEPTASRTAQKMGAIDTIEWNLLRAVEDAALVIIATPVLSIRSVLELAGPHLRESCVVTDTGSTKGDVLKWADELLPKHVSFVGGHPMAGKELSGPGSAEAKLFEGATYCILPGSNATAEAVATVVAMVEVIGAIPFFIDAQEHDSFVAAASHLPIVLSSALVASTAKSPSWPEISRLAANGYRDVSRLASGDPEMSRDICMTNAREVAAWVDRLVAELLEVKRHLDNADEEGLARHFAHAYEEREKWVAGVPLRSATSQVELPSATERLSTLLMGELLTRRSKALLQQYENPGDKGKRRGWGGKDR